MSNENNNLPCIHTAQIIEWFKESGLDDVNHHELFNQLLSSYAINNHNCHYYRLATLTVLKYLELMTMLSGLSALDVSQIVYRKDFIPVEEK